MTPKVFLVFLLYALFASIFTIGKHALYYTEPFFLVGVRMLLAGVVLVGFSYFFHRDRFSLPRKLWRPLFWLAVFNVFFTNAFEFWGLKYLSSSKTCFIYSLSPFASAIISYFYFSEKITPIKFIGMCIGFAGFIPIFLTDSSSEDITSRFGFLSLAEISVLVAAISTVYGWIIMRDMVTKHGYPTFLANGISMFLGGVMSLATSFFVENWDPVPVRDWEQFILWLLAMTVISNFICYNLYGFLLKTFTATFMSFSGFSTPLFVSFFGWIFLNEFITWKFVFSVVVVFLGLSIFYREELRQGYVNPSTQ